MSRLALALLLGAAASCDGDRDRAVDPVWGKQPCAQCAMLVEDRLSAAQLATKSGERLHFDDVGCMVLFEREHPGKTARAWVRTPTGDGWTTTEQARFRGGAKTPMDYGFVPATDGITFSEVSERVVAKVRP